jgi:hypothetical protein
VTLLEIRAKLARMAEEALLVVESGPGITADRFRRAVEAAGGRFAGAAGGAWLARFPAPEAALSCADDVRGGRRALLHWVLLSEAGALDGDDAARRAVQALGDVAPGTVFVTSAFKARLSAAVRDRFGRQMLGSWLPGWTDSARSPAPVHPPLAAPAAPPVARARGVGDIVVRAFQRALDAVDRSFTRPPSEAELLEALASAGRPLTLEEIADLHHLTRGRTRKILDRLIERTWVERRPDDTYAVIPEDHRLQAIAKRKGRSFQNHLRTYLAVNGGLILVNLLSTGGDPFWAAAPLLGWGIGLFFHGMSYREALREARARRREEPLEVAAPALRPPWSELGAAALGSLREIEAHGAEHPPSPEIAEKRAALLAGYAQTVSRLAAQGSHLDALLSRFDRAHLEEELAQARAGVDVERDARLAASHHERARLLESQMEMLEGIERHRQATLLKLKNLLTTLENISLDMSRAALAAREDQIDAILTQGASDLAAYRDWYAEAMAEIDRLLRS